MLIDQINVVNCSASEVLGTGLEGCQLDFGIIKAIGLLQSGYKFPATSLDKDAIQLLQQQGKLIYLKGIVGFSDTTPESNYETNANTGIKKLLLEMPYEFEATFDNGINFQKALTTLSGHSNYDLVLFDAEDRVWVTYNKAGDVKGYTLGLHQKGNYGFKDGTKSASQKLMLQLLDRNEIDLRAASISPDDFSFSDLDGVNQVAVSIEPTAPGTSIVFKAMLGDNTHLVEGLTVPLLKVTKGGTAITPSAISYTTNPGYITLTVAALIATDVVTIQVYDNVLGVPIALTAVGALYKSNVATVVVA